MPNNNPQGENQYTKRDKSRQQKDKDKSGSNQGSPSPSRTGSTPSQDRSSKR
jgi:hypothetical protein